MKFLVLSLILLTSCSSSKICSDCKEDNYANYQPCWAPPRNCKLCTEKCCSTKQDRCCCLHRDECACANPTR